ncbi:hypothetical protein CBF23_008735 [Marinomonas agarivorans]|nr:hypothetical protein CBF23_008735 [Marinomonas agarivorans]
MQDTAKKTQNKPLIRRLTAVLIVFLVTSTIASLGVFFLASTNRNSHILNTYESTLWSSLQLQMQTYRFLDFLRTLENNPENAIDAYSHYGLLMSRVDLLKMGPISNQIHYISDGRSIRLLNIIHGEFELLNDVVLEIENNDLTQLNATIEKLKQLDSHINRLVNLINQGSQSFSVESRKRILAELAVLQYFVIFFLINALILFVILFHNIKVTRLSLQTVDEIQEKIATLMQKKKNFLMAMGHEVRTPLDRCLSMIALLKDTKLNKEQREILTTTEEANQSLQHLITDFLDLSQIESGNLELNYRPVNLHQEIDEALRIVNEQSNHKGVQLLNYIDLNLPAKAVIDAKRLRQIIFNLVDNSFKFTQKGHISVVTRLAQSKPTLWRPNDYEDTNVTMIQIIIKDTGIGVPEKVAELLRTPIHEESMQIPESRSNLGLSLCRFLAHLMHGNIVCHSPLAGGSEFILELPIFHHQTTSIKASPSIAHVLETMTDKNMVIIEKDPSVAHLLSMQANGLGIQTPVYNGLLHDLPEQKIDFVYIANDTTLDDMSYMNLKKLLNSGAIFIASHQLSRPKSKSMARHLYDLPLLHLSMFHNLNAVNEKEKQGHPE